MCVCVHARTELLGGRARGDDSKGGAASAAGAATTTATDDSMAHTALLELAAEDRVASVRATAVGALARLAASGAATASRASAVALEKLLRDAVVLAAQDTDHAVREAAVSLAVQLQVVSSTAAQLLPPSSSSSSLAASAAAAAAAPSAGGSAAALLSRARGGGGGAGAGRTGIDASTAYSRRLVLGLLDDVDPRVRAAGLRALPELDRAGGGLELASYITAQRALGDDAETVRSSALAVIHAFGVRLPDESAPAGAESYHTARRLGDNAFVTLCSAVTDL
jgi:hypothetical protein